MKKLEDLKNNVVIKKLDFDSSHTMIHKITNPKFIDASSEI